MTLLEKNEWQSSSLLRLAGYGLLLLVLFDLVDVLLPIQFKNPIWEFQTIGALVERVAFPLLAFVLIFYQEANFRTKWELSILKFLSWLSLLVGVIYLLLIPLNLSNASRINALNNDQITTQSLQQTSQLQQLQAQIDKATANDLEGLLARINNQGNSPDIKNTQELKSRLLTEINNTEKALKTQTDAIRTNKSRELTKSSLKWNLGALVSGVLFIRIWQVTHWTRRSPKRQRGW